MPPWYSVTIICKIYYLHLNSVGLKQLAHNQFASARRFLPKNIEKIQDKYYNIEISNLYIA